MKDKNNEGFIKLLCHVNISKESDVIQALEECLSEYKLLGSEETRNKLQMAQTALSLKLILRDVSFDQLLNDVIAGKGKIAGSGAGAFAFTPSQN